MWNKTDPSLVMPKLSFLSEARTEDVVSQIMATVVIRAYIGASEMHVALETLQLKVLYRSFADAAKWNLINFSDGSHMSMLGPRQRDLIWPKLNSSRRVLV